jgi:hypothetical protein
MQPSRHTTAAWVTLSPPATPLTPARLTVGPQGIEIGGSARVSRWDAGRYGFLAEAT